MDYLKLIADADAALKSGRADETSRLLHTIDPKAVPEGSRLALANLCRRSGLNSWGLKILMPAIYSHKDELNPDADHSELAEYAALLERMGAASEALNILSYVDTSRVPQAHLFRAFVFFKSWNYGAAIPELTTYTSIIQDPYAKLIGHVNLAAAYVANFALKEARDLLNELIFESERLGYKRLRGNCFELRSQVALHEGQFSHAKSDLQAAADIFTSEKTIDRFFVDKWLAILEACENQNIEPLTSFRALSVQRADWETVRECDLFRCRSQFDETLFHQLFFGTPYAHYRWRVMTLLNRIPEKSEFVFGAADSPCLDLSTGLISNGQSPGPGKAIHKILAVLLRDFYRPIRPTEIFAELYPGEHYNPYSSPSRVRQVLTRLRKWTRENHVPLNIHASGSDYRLLIDGAFSVKMSLNGADVSSWSPLWNSFRQHFDVGQEFSAKELRQALELKPTRAAELLKWAVQSNHAEPLGNFSFRTYRIVA